MNISCLFLFLMFSQSYISNFSTISKAFSLHVRTYDGKKMLEHFLGQVKLNIYLGKCQIHDNLIIHKQIYMITGVKMLEHP